jgi:hypothetical protein
MKNSERDEDAFEETPRPKRPALPSDEKAPRKAPPPVDEAYVEDAQERPGGPKAREAEEDEDRPRRRPRYEDEDEEDDRSRRPARRRQGEPYSTLIPYRNVPALVGYYCGMCGLIAILGGIALILFNPVNRQWAGVIYFGVMNGLGGILALLGIILGIVGMVYASRNPRSRGMGHAITGMVLGVLEILGLLAILIFWVMVSRRF